MGNFNFDILCAFGKKSTIPRKAGKNKVTGKSMYQNSGIKALKGKFKGTLKKDTFALNSTRKSTDKKELKQQTANETSQATAPLSEEIEKPLEEISKNNPVVKEAAQDLKSTENIVSEVLEPIEKAISEDANPKALKPAEEEAAQEIKKSGVLNTIKSHKVATGLAAAAITIGGFIGIKTHQNKQSDK